MKTSSFPQILPMCNEFKLMDNKFLWFSQERIYEIHNCYPQEVYHLESKSENNAVNNILDEIPTFFVKPAYLNWICTKFRNFLYFFCFVSFARNFIMQVLYKNKILFTSVKVYIYFKINVISLSNHCCIFFLSVYYYMYWPHILAVQP